MGLDIHGAVSKKEYHFSYSGLHLIRWLALLVCGMPRQICGETSFSWEGRPFLHGYVMQGKELPNPELMGTIIWSYQQAGYIFPNLMLHSDCEGSYTKTGQVLQENDGHLLKGNSIKLLKELEFLKDSLTEELKKEERAVVLFNNLYELVKDEVKNGKGRLTFS